MVAQLTPLAQTELQTGDPVVARWSDQATGTVVETFTKGTRKPVHWATVEWQTGDSAGKTSSHPFKQLRKAEPTEPEASKQDSPEPGDYVRGVTVEGEPIAGFVDSVGRKYIKLRSGNVHQIKSLEVVCRLPESLEVYCDLVGVERIEKLHRLFGNYRFYDLSAWQTADREEDYTRLENYRDWQILRFRSSEVDIHKDKSKWYFDLKRKPELQTDADVRNYCIEAIDYAENVIAKLEAYEQQATGKLPEEAEAPKRKKRATNAKPTSTRKDRVNRSPISDLKFQQGERVAGQMYFQGQNRPFIGAVVAAEFDTAVRLEWLMEVDGEICRGDVQMPIVQLEKLDAADPRLCCPVSLPSPTAECLRAIDEEYQAALEGQSQEWVVADGFAVSDHTWKPLLASAEPTTLEELATRINALDREAAEAEAVSINACRSALEMRRQQGEMLLQAKSQLKHGEWLPWLGKHCTVGDRQAQKYMKIAKGWDALIAKANSDAFLTIDQAVKMLSAEKEKPPKEKLPTIEEIHQLYMQVGTIKPQPTPSLPNAFQVLNESFGMPFPLYFKGVREALKYWQTKGDQLVRAVNRVAAQQAAQFPAQSCQQCKHRSLTDDGSTWQCDARADGYQHPVTRDIASEAGCRLFKALAPVSVEIINPVIAPEQEDEPERELAGEPEQNTPETPAATLPAPSTASITDALDPPPQPRAAIYSPHRQPLNRPESKPVPAPVTVCLKLTNFGKQLDLSGVIAQIVVQTAGQTYALTCDDLILETES